MPRHSALPSPSPVAGGSRERPSSCFPAARKRRCPPPTSQICGYGCPVGMGPSHLPTPPRRHLPRQRRKLPPCRLHPSPPHRNHLCLPTSPPLRRPRRAPTVGPRAWCGDTVTAGVASGVTPSFRVPTDGKCSGSEGSRALRTLPLLHNYLPMTTGCLLQGVRTLVVTAHNFCMEHSIAS